MLLPPSSLFLISNQKFSRDENASLRICHNAMVTRQQFCEQHILILKRSGCPSSEDSEPRFQSVRRRSPISPLLPRPPGSISIPSGLVFHSITTRMPTRRSHLPCSLFQSLICSFLKYFLCEAEFGQRFGDNCWGCTVWASSQNLRIVVFFFVEWPPCINQTPFSHGCFTSERERCQLDLPNWKGGMLADRHTLAMLLVLC